LNGRLLISQASFAVAVRRMKSLDLSYLEPRILELSNTMEKLEIWESWQQWKKSLEKNKP
jgi:hypothetical protein